MPLSDLFFNPPVHRWLGVSGEWHDHEVYATYAVPRLAGVNYIFARVRPDGYFDALYIGQSGDFEDRLDAHEKWRPALSLGMTHVHIRRTMNQAERFRIETDLRNKHATPLNLQPTLADALRGAFSPRPGLGATLLTGNISRSPLGRIRLGS